MLVLAIDTATEATSVAVVGDGVRVECHVVEGRRHAEVIAPLIQQALRGAGVSPADIELVACGVGPGPFTGLRVGIATALAFGAARDIPVVGACSLDVIARAAVRDEPREVSVLTRARRAEVCWAAYDASGIRRAGPLIRPDGDAFEGRCVGDVGPVEAIARPHAADLADLVRERLEAGEPLPGAVPLPEDDASAAGASSADVLERRARDGLLLLPALPIYLRRPDAVAPASVGIS